MNLNDELSIHTQLKSALSVKETKEPDARRLSSDFGESACGEPLAPQRLLVDFTPNDEDTEYVQKKCCAFWDFITSCPELENCLVLPASISEKTSRQSDIELAPIKPRSQEQETAKTAVSMIEFVEEKGLITRAFEAELPQSCCSIGSRDYFDEKPTISRVIDKEVCNCKTCRRKTLQQQPRVPSENVQDMCRELQNWDTQHPKTTSKLPKTQMNMIQLPKFQRDPKASKNFCKCCPVCKSRRREWKGEVQHTSAELLLDRKPLAECFRRWPTKVYSNSPCPLFGKTHRVIIRDRGVIQPATVVRICQAPLDVNVDTPYLQYVQLASALGALDAVHACCAFCACAGCCACQARDYCVRDVDRAATRRHDMRAFDARVKHAGGPMKIMYN